MKQVIIDTNFILSCIEKKIDFIQKLEMEGFKILLPKQVISELEKLSKKDKKLKSQQNSVIALRILLNNNLKTMDLKNTYVDKGIMIYLKENPEIFLATLDKELLRKTRKKIILRDKGLDITGT